MYFSNCNTVAEIKKQYRQLAMINHPDKGGSTETMQAINSEYQYSLNRKHESVEYDTDNNPHTYYYSKDHEEELMNKISQLISLKMDGVDIWLIGKWIWVEGNTKSYKNALGKNGLGLQWHTKRLAWYWKPYTYSGLYNGKASLEDLADKYGAKSFAKENENSVILA